MTREGVALQESAADLPPTLPALTALVVSAFITGFGLGVILAVLGILVGAHL